MGRRKDSPLQVKDFYREKKQSLDLTSVGGETGFSRNIRSPSSKEIHAPVQVWGKKEIRAFNNLSPRKRRSSFYQETKHGIACIILSGGLYFLSEIEEEAKKRTITLFRSPHSRRRCREEVKDFFELKSSNKIVIYGGLLQMFGMGVLIRGDSGVGKSESALELISRGHRFISDDVTQITKNREGKLIGKAPSLSQYFMEIRGLGIINIKEIFGVRAVSPQVEIKLIIQLKKWKEGKEYDRLSLKFWDDDQILGQKIPQIIIPVAPGRNMATLIEVACKVHKLREKGYLAPQDMTERLNRALRARS